MQAVNQCSILYQHYICFMGHVWPPTYGTISKGKTEYGVVAYDVVLTSPVLCDDLVVLFLDYI